ncbi:hypothetical protein IE53DRAFT_377956 [Violaceomyces palustris]|uniref:Uncharacterized protein n=1 Tax=Violaceomyces palustris TaxID=1673888 RepID=A0ACD0P3Z3_9BASI|nr:hypothetical protein IE53DRAFT_377956 [Violaceomyces palustris]
MKSTARIVMLTEIRSAAWRRIYEEGLSTGHASFSDTPPTWSEYDGFALKPHRYLAIDSIDGRACGWISVSDARLPINLGSCSDPSSSSSSSSSSSPFQGDTPGVVEVLLHVAERERRRGIGLLLLNTLIESTLKSGIWTLQAHVFRENGAALALLHQKGFRTVGTRERVGKMRFGAFKGCWRDVILLERRASREEMGEVDMDEEEVVGEQQLEEGNVEVPLDPHSISLVPRSRNTSFHGSTGTLLPRIDGITPPADTNQDDRPSTFSLLQPPFGHPAHHPLWPMTSVGQTFPCVPDPSNVELQLEGSQDINLNSQERSPSPSSKFQAPTSSEAPLLAPPLGMVEERQQVMDLENFIDAIVKGDEAIF